MKKGELPSTFVREVLFARDRLHNICPVCFEVLPLSETSHCGVQVLKPYTCTYRLETMIQREEGA